MGIYSTPFIQNYNYQVAIIVSHCVYTIHKPNNTEYKKVYFCKMEDQSFNIPEYCFLLFSPEKRCDTSMKYAQQGKLLSKLVNTG